MGQADFLRLGDWNADCSMCGLKFKASALKRHWQGQWRCVKCWEPRQPQDFVRNVVDDTSVPWAQPDNSTFIDPYSCTVQSSSSVADDAAADCSTPA
jgi:hypothetical protein